MCEELVQIKIKNLELYKVSKNGKIWSDVSRKFLKTKICNGYEMITITSKNITMSIHKIVALTFLENPDNKEQVNHKDGNKLNNAVENLEWCSNRENQIHKFKIGLGNNFTRKIGQYDLSGNLIKEFKSIVSASKELDIGKSNIMGVLTNSRKTAGGFIFKYLD